jgi:hypothetical protein
VERLDTRWRKVSISDLFLRRWSRRCSGDDGERGGMNGWWTKQKWNREELLTSSVCPVALWPYS